MMWLGWIAVAALASSMVGGAALVRAVRRGARRRTELLVAAAARTGETVELAGLTFALEPTIRALCDRARLDLAEALLARPPAIDPWTIVMLARPRADAGPIEVPGLVDFHCPACDRRHAGRELIVRGERGEQREIYTARCPMLHPLPGLPPYLVIY